MAVVASYTNERAKSGDLLVMPCTSTYMRVNVMGKSILTGGVEVTNSGCSPPFQWGGAASAADGWNDGKLHSFGLRIGKAIGGVAVRVDGVQWGQTTAIDTSQSGSILMIGGRSCLWCDAGPTPIEEPLEGYIAEVVMALDTPGTPTQIAQLSAYFQKKYGIPF